MTSQATDRRLFHEMQHVARIATWEFDELRQQMHFSELLFELFGLEPGEEPPTPDEFVDWCVPDSRDAVRTALQEARRTGRPQGAEFRLSRMPDRVFVGHLRYDLDADGRPVTAWGTVQDVTQQRAEAEALRQSEQRLAEAERLARSGSFDYHADSGENLWSPGLFRLMGLDPSAPTPSAEEYFDMLEPGSREIAAREYRTALEEGRSSYAYDFNPRSGGGRRRWISVRAEIYDAPEGRRIRGTMQDVTIERRAAQRDAALAQFGLAALRAQRREELFSTACDVMRETVEAHLTGALELQANGKMRLVSSTGWEDLVGEEVSTDLPAVTLQAFREGRRIVVDDWLAEQETPYYEPLRAAGVRATIALPVPGSHGMFGVLGVHAREPHYFDDGDVRFLEALVVLLGTAVERLRAEAEVAELAETRGRLVAYTVEAEERVRRRISENLHDGPLQDLLAARQDLAEAAGATGAARDDLLGHARAGVERAVAELREAVGALHPVVLQHGGLEAALQAAGDGAARRGGFAFALDVHPDAVGPRDALIVSLARELLANAVKHARASRVCVRVTREDDALVLEVSDDGVGIDPAIVARAPREGHIGVASLVQRVEAAGGEVQIGPGPSGGTTACVRLPVD